MGRRKSWVLVLALMGAVAQSSGAQPKRAKPGKEAAAKPGKEAAAKAPAEKPDKTDKTEKADKPEKAEKPDKAAAAEGAVEAGTANGEEPASSDDLGPPPKRTPNTEGVRPSPLNPRADEFPAGTTTLPPRAYDDLLAEIATLRGRVAALTTTLFASKLRISVEAEGDNARIARLVVTVDDGVVYNAPGRFTADEPRIVYEHGVAPGYHVVAVEVERYDARNQQYRTWQTSKFAVVVPESKRLDAAVSIEDDSGMAEDFPDDRDGEYELSVRLRASVEE